MQTDESTKWIMSVDRRMLVMRDVHENGIIRVSELASHSGRSIQNISRAIHELEAEGLVECITPEKNTWKRYILTEHGKMVYERMRDLHLFE
ncbi:MAG: MarR family protein [Methanomassiliicoccales archaeon PtaU1.Bin124]|nr:MAG: MarR family protein [Methanomassiliicoccales archaeon PtaU1.Bin124]